VSNQLYIKGSYLIGVCLVV